MKSASIPVMLGGLAKAKLKNLDSQDTVEVMFNPERLNLSRSISYSFESGIGSSGISSFEEFKKNQYLEYNGGSGDYETLTVTLFFDTTDEDEDVRQHTEKVVKMSEVGQYSVGDLQKEIRTPWIAFEWGDGFNIEGVITQLNQDFVRFSRKGYATRANLTITITAMPDRNKWGKKGWSTAAKVAVGLAAVATAGAGAAALALMATNNMLAPDKWRELADEYDLDDPANLAKIAGMLTGA